MLRLKGLGHYKMTVRVAKATWKGQFRWLIYPTGIGFYHMQMNLSAGAIIELKRHLMLWLK